MDLVGPISPSISQYRYILTLMDGFSRYVKTVPLRTKTAQEVAEAVLSGWIKGPGGGGPRKVPGGQRHRVHGHDRTGDFIGLCGP